MNVISHSPKAVADPPVCLYSSGAISEQYSQTQPCNAQRKKKKKTKMTPMLAHQMLGVCGTANSTVKINIRIDEITAPQSRIVRRSSFFTV